ncbi:hypothetical protein PACTADRAFT_3220 [Pachysolen tannophilus NRRL Y-2460]|uniref:E3 ubiquitin-protein ligase n=1 Tax=Pachysolen tannophilus NRRL Y-2460 TaxID=669874 RepID=A0A1E4TUU6_PACTA|nr:hypothetical protein PACTADRAFT_3220 [Pachysolen tannophilus NRRL Y-2460]
MDGLELYESYDTTELRRSLICLPQLFNYKFNKDTARSIRRLLYFCVSHDGKYINEFFSGLRYESLDWSKINSGAKDGFNWQINDSKMEDPSHPNRPCTKKFRQSEPIYRCLTCGLDDTCALCSNCFNEEAHEGHQIYITISQKENAGVCDCGDPEAWTRDIHCKYHEGNIEEKELPGAFYNSLFNTFEVILDYVIDVMANSYLMYSDIAHTPEKLEAFSNNSSLLESKYGFKDVNTEEYCLLLYNDHVRQRQDAVQRIHVATGKIKEFAEMITREVEDYGRAKVIRLDCCIRSRRDIFREDMCDEIIRWITDITNSSIFQKYKSFRDLVAKAFVKKWQGGINNQLYDPEIDDSYCPGSLDSQNLIPRIPEILSSSNPIYWNFKYTKWDLPDNLCQDCDYNTDEMISNIYKEQNFKGSRLQYFLYFDIRFWKSIRMILHDMYNFVLISNLNFKSIVNCQYVDIYPQISEMFLKVDREPEYSLMASLSTQLFTCPSNATLIVKHGSLSILLATAYGFLTTGRVALPNSVDLDDDIDFNCLKNRKWGQIFFDLAYIISRSQNELASGIFNSTFLNQLVDLLLLFQGRPTMKRFVDEHVEYESNDYTIYFHSVSLINHFIESIARCCGKLDKNNPEHKKLLENSVHLVVKRLALFINLQDLRVSRPSDSLELDPSSEKYRLISDVLINKMEYVQFAQVKIPLIKFEVSKQSVSLFHPLHSFLSLLVELNEFCETNEDLENIFSPIDPIFLTKYGYGNAPINSSLQIFDYPLRTIVLLSQIKVGFWVRNGFSVRNQLQIYRKTAIRESGFIKDVFLTQCFVSSQPKEVTAPTILLRWELISWVDGSYKDKKSVYDDDTLSYIVEECLLFFINLLTEGSHLSQKSIDKINESRIIKEVIHCLCLKHLSFSAILSDIPEHITGEKKFEYILDKVSDFIPPKSYNDVGMFRLKEEYFKEIDPYYIHYTSNKRDEAIKVLKERIHKKTGKPMDEIYLEPKILSEVETKVFKVARFTTSVYFILFLRNTFQYVFDKGLSKADTLLDLALHLLHICCLYNYDEEFNKLLFDKPLKNSGLSSNHLTDDSVISILYSILTQEYLKSYHSSTRGIFRVISKSTLNFERLMSESIDDYNPKFLTANFSDNFMETEENELNKKKKLAQMRQKKILEKFKRRQDKFLAKNNYSILNSETSDVEMTDVTDGGDDNANDSNEHCSSLISSGDCWQYPEELCILCQMKKDEDEPFGIVSYISNSSEFRNVPFDSTYWFLKSFSDNESLDHKNVDFEKDSRYSSKWHDFIDRTQKEAVIGPPFPSNDGLIEDNCVVTSCCHGMHYSCFSQYFKESRKRSTQIIKTLPENFDKNEFLCPLCKSLNNCFLPIVAASNTASLAKYISCDNIDDDWFNKFDALENLENFELVKNQIFQEFSRNLKEKVNPIFYEALFNQLLENENGDSNNNNNNNNNNNDSPLEIPKYLSAISNVVNHLNSLSNLLVKLDFNSILIHTIESTEISLRGVPQEGAGNEIIINQLSNKSLTTLRTWNQLREAVQALRIVQDIKYEKLLKRNSSNNDVADNFNFIDQIEQILGRLNLLGSDDLIEVLLSIDFLKFLVECEAIETLKISFNEIMNICYISQVLQNCYLLVYRLLGSDTEIMTFLMEIPIIENINFNVEKLQVIFQKIYKHINQTYNLENTFFRHNLESSEKFIKILYSMVIKLMTPFLRKTVIFAFIKCANLDHIDFHNLDVKMLEIDRLTNFLKLPSIHDLFNQKFHTPKSVPNIIFEKLVTFKPTLIMDLSVYNLKYPGIISLIELPKRLDNFFTYLYYPLNLRNIINPAICLHCRAIVDMQNISITNRQGECIEHYKNNCFSNDNGIFLIPKNSRLLLLHDNIGSFHDAPYLDPHGELDKEGKHGQVMYLSKERYENFIRSVWLGHDIPNYITRTIENNVDVGGWETL